MSRQYLNERWCVRCGREGPTPYLRDNWEKLVDDRDEGYTLRVLDIGCGNGRNAKFMREKGFDVVALDMAPGHEDTPYILGVAPMPLFASTVDIILANYVMMFLDAKERKQVLKDILHAAAPGCVIMVEFYEAKDSECPDKASMLKLQQEVFDALGWEKVKYSQGRFIARNSE